MSASHFESEVPGDCTVRVVRCSGECVLCTTIEEPKEIVVLSLALVAACAKKLNVPRMCLNLVWPRIQRSFNDLEPLVLDVQLVTSQISPNPRPPEDYECVICFDPCVCAYDLPTADDEWEMRISNCRKCTPPWLCKNCRLPVGTYVGGWVCFECVKEEDMVVWTDSQAQRARWIGLGPLAMPTPRRVWQPLAMPTPRWCQSLLLMMEPSLYFISLLITMF